jgi:hypothetical protein
VVKWDPHHPGFRAGVFGQAFEVFESNDGFKRGQMVGQISKSFSVDLRQQAI